MVERTILIEPSQRRFTASVKPAFRAAKNVSYALATPCCSKADHPVRRKQQYVCEECKNEVDTKSCTHKIVEIGKEEALIDAKLLEQIKEQIESRQEITISEFLDEEPSDMKDRIEDTKYLDVVKKGDAQYAELAKVLKGKVAFGRGSFGGNDKAIAMQVKPSGVIAMYMLADETQRVDFDDSKVKKAMEAKVPESLVDLQKKLIDKRQKEHPFDFDGYMEENIDTRIKMEQDLIEQAILNGAVPQFVAPVVEEKKVQDEEARLKALLGE